MRAAIYNPYLDSLGGGERYSMTFAKILADKGWHVDIGWKDSSIKNELEKRFGFNLNNMNFVSEIKRGDGYDVCFWVSDGSIPTLLARKNFLHFQVPFRNVDGGTLLNKMKLFRINKIICNSYFTKKFIDKEYGVTSLIIYPPVDVKQIKSGKKENLVLSVGRFSQLEQAKRQDVLVEAFKKLYDEAQDRKWKFVLVGGVEVGAADFVEKLKKQVVGYPISIVRSPSFKQLLNFYAKAKIFWSASGFGIDEEKEPAKVEHFGITVVEAMAAGCASFAYNAGGHKEIIKNSSSGFLWESVDSLLRETKKVIDSPKLFREISLNAQKASQEYSYEHFEEEVIKLVYENFKK